MQISDVAEIRTGCVLARKEANVGCASREYRALNLKCIDPSGYIRREAIEPFHAQEKLESDVLTHIGDILVRLSYPYTAVLIAEQDLVGLLIPSHFAVVRARQGEAVPEYLYWAIKRQKSLITITQNSSGSTALGTISSGLIGSLTVARLPMEQQRCVGGLARLMDREQELLAKLAALKKIYHACLITETYNRLKRGNP